jgi:hypothetical protein
MKHATVPCLNCGQDIIDNDGIIVFVKGIQPGKITDVYPCCKGPCEQILNKSRVGQDEIDFSIELSDITTPDKFYAYVTGFMDRLYEGLKMDDRAYRKLRTMMDSTAQRVLSRKE